MSGCITYTPGPVIFNYDTWALRFPELATGVIEPVATMYFAEACIVCDNTSSSLIQDNSVGGARELILNYLVAHIAKLFATVNGVAPSPIVGRINSATQGSVSVQADMGTTPFTAAWFMQTQYGASAYQLMAPWRTARYRPGRRPYLGVMPFGRQGFPY